MTRRVQKRLSLAFMLVGVALSMADLYLFAAHHPSPFGKELMLGKYAFLAIGILLSPMVGVYRRPLEGDR